MTDLAEITETIRARVAANGAPAKSFKLNFGGDGLIRIADGAVTNDDGPADVTIHVSLEDFKALATGKLDPMGAFMSGKLKVDGNPMDAMALQSLLK